MQAKTFLHVNPKAHKICFPPFIKTIKSSVSYTQNSNILRLLPYHRQCQTSGED